MSRTELFDKILKHLIKHPNNYWVLNPTCKDLFGITDRRLIEHIGDELIERGWATHKKDDKYSVYIQYEGIQMMEKYGSYSAFIDQLEKTQKKDKAIKRTDRVLNITSKIAAIIFGITSFFLAYNKFFKDDRIIKSQELQIEQLNQKIDSLIKEQEEYQIISVILNHSYSHETDDQNGLSWIDLSKPYNSLLVLSHTNLRESDIQSLKDYLSFNSLSDFSIVDFRTSKKWNIDKIKNYDRYELEAKTNQSISSPYIGMIQISSISFNENLNKALIYTSFLCAGSGDCGEGLVFHLNKGDKWEVSKVESLWVS